MATSIDELQIEIRGTAQNANRSINNLTKNLDRLQNSINRIDVSKFKELSINTTKVSSSAKKLSSNVSQMNTNTKKLTANLSNLNLSANKTHKSFSGLAGLFGKFYANFFWVIRGIKGILSSIESTSDYLETLNFFNVAINKIGNEWSGEWEKYGSKSAESYAKSFRQRLNADLKKMSGIEIEVDSENEGLLSSTGLKNLGLNIREVTQYMAQLASVTNSVGLSGEASYVAASAFAKLAGDISSLFNVDYSVASQNLQSGLIGQSRAELLVA